jgi:hypothetical protein
LLQRPQKSQIGEAESMLKTTRRLTYCPAYPSFGQEIIGDKLAARVTYLLKMNEISAWTFGLRRQTGKSSQVAKEFLNPPFERPLANMRQAAG